MKREFNDGDTAYLTNGKRMKGFTLSAGNSVKIVKGEKISEKHGGYLYTIEVTNPKTNKTIVLDGWLTQHDLMSKAMHNKMMQQEKLIEDLEAKFHKK